MQHLINWIEIPVLDMDRAVIFYEKVFGGIDFHTMQLNEFEYAIFPKEDRFNCGALVKSEFSLPSKDGITVYFNGGDDLAPMLNRVEGSGGNIILEKTYLSPEAGFIGLFIDSEGNKIGLQNL